MSYPTPALSGREFDFNCIFTERSKKGESSSMAQIPMPPRPGMSPMDWKFCVKSKEPLEFILPNPSFFDHSTDGLFNPELPGNPKSPLPAGVVGPFTPVGQGGEVVVGIFDDTTKQLFVMTLIIKPTCP